MKNTILKFWAVCLFAIVAAGCEKPDTGEDGPSKGQSGLLSDVTVKLSFDDVTATTATAACSMFLGKAAEMPAELILECSVSENFPFNATTVKKLDKNASSVTLEGLLFDRTYYYRAYIKLYETEYSLDEGSFTTSAVSVVMDEPRETEEGLMLSGQLRGMSADDREYLDTYLYICESEFPEHSVRSFEVQADEENSFTVTVSELAIDTEYTYWWAIRDGEVKSVEGEKTSYRSLNPYMSSLQASSAGSDLSAAGTANCYIVPAAGAYKFKMTKGNTSEPVGAVAAVRVLWESFGTLTAPKPFELICATGMDGDYALFEVPQTYKEGNAVIAAYDAQENILWSWHIWLTDDQMSQDTYYVCESGVFMDEIAGVMMDRNLGAFSTEPNSIETFGLFYQWGRKDPFLGSANVAGTAYARSTRNLKVGILLPEEQTVGYATANPHMFIIGNDRKDWVAEKDNSLWTNGAKSQYDPCPVGWRVPDGGTGLNGVQAGIWAKIGISAYGKTAMPDSWQSGWKGMKFPISEGGYSSYYPAAGGIGLDSALYLVGVDGTYWSATPLGGNRDEVFAMNFYFTAAEDYFYEFCGAEIPRATGNSVRCSKE